MALLAATLVYPVLGTSIRVNDRFPGPRPPIGTLDGMAYMSVGSYTWPDESNRIELQYDYDAIRWLLANVTGTPVVAEAKPALLPGGRAAGVLDDGIPHPAGHAPERTALWMAGSVSGMG